MTVAAGADAAPVAKRRALDDLATMAVTAGAVAAGVALIEVALLPGLALGAAVVVAPRLASGALPWLRRRVAPLRGVPAAIPRLTHAAPEPIRARREPDSAMVEEPPPIARRLGVDRAFVKTVTYRIVVTGLDFTWNVIVIGEIATAAGLSGLSLVGGPLFYFVHEATWNYFESSARQDGRSTEWRGLSIGRVTVGRALAKTIVFRTLASAIEFATNFAVVRDLGQATVLTIPGFVIGPFVYLGHEVIWDRLWPVATLAPPSGRKPALMG